MKTGDDYVILSDGDIARELNKGSLRIIPTEENKIQPCSIDMELASELKTLDGKTIDISQDSYHLKPNEFILGSTYEYVEIPNYLCGQVDGKSSLARLGISIHQTGGYIDAGFRGNITLEIYNASDKTFELFNGMSICQMILHVLSSECIRPYGSDGLGSKYQDSTGTVRSKYVG